MICSGRKRWQLQVEQAGREREHPVLRWLWEPDQNVKVDQRAFKADYFVYTQMNCRFYNQRFTCDYQMGWYALQKYIVMWVVMFFVGTHLTSRNAKWIFPSKKALHHLRNFSLISFGMSLNDFKSRAKAKLSSQVWWTSSPHKVWHTGNKNRGSIISSELAKSATRWWS